MEKDEDAMDEEVEQQQQLEEAEWKLTLQNYTFFSFTTFHLRFCSAVDGSLDAWLGRVLMKNKAIKTGFF